MLVSHDRYFLSRVAESVLIFENQSAFYYPFGYEHYLERSKRAEKGEGLAAQIRAEEQALIAGMRAVPKAEKHRLREIPVEEAYMDWKLGLVLERLLPVRNRVMELADVMEEMKERWLGSEDFWKGEIWEEAGRYEELKEEQQKAWEEWHELCLEWFDTAYEEET